MAERFLSARSPLQYMHDKGYYHSYIEETLVTTTPDHPQALVPLPKTPVHYFPSSLSCFHIGGSNFFLGHPSGDAARELAAEIPSSATARPALDKVLDSTVNAPPVR